MNMALQMAKTCLLKSFIQSMHVPSFIFSIVETEGLSGSTPCHCYISPDIPEAAALTSSFQSDFHPISNIILCDQLPPATMICTQSAQTTLHEVLDINPFDFQCSGLTCTVTVSSLSPEQTWWFFSCNKCSRKSVPENNSYTCSLCPCRSAKPRTISSTSVQASDIRPLPVLRETMDYLLHLLDSSEHPFDIVHDFIFDRTRSVRQDLSMQNIANDQAIQIYEDVIKFHILSHQRLARSFQDSDASSLCYLNMEQLMKCLLSLFDMYHIIHKSNSHSNKEAEYYSFYVLLHLGCKIPKMVDSLSLWYSQLTASIIRSKEIIFARTILRCYNLGNFKRFFCMIAAEATDLQLRLVEPFLNEVRARALMYFNHSGYKLQHHPLTHLSETLLIEESELETLCRICGLEISKNGDTKAFAPKQTSFSLPTSINRSSGIYISREIDR